MDFDIPAELDAYLNELDRFIEEEIKPLENENDNIRFFDHRREDARTDWDRGGFQLKTGKLCFSKLERERTGLGIIVLQCPKSWGVKTVGIWLWL